MHFTVTPKLQNRKTADALVLPLWKGKNGAEPAADFKELLKEAELPIATKDFTGKESEILFLYVDKHPEKRIILLGLGDQEKISVEKLRRAYSNLVKASRQKKCKTLNVLVPEVSALPEENIIRGISEGMLLSNYYFDKLKHDALKNEPTTLLTRACLIGVSKQAQNLADKYAKIAQGVYLARDLVNGNADDVSPQYLAQVAKELAKKLPRVKATVFDRTRIRKEKMGLLNAVGRGSKDGPTFTIIEYKGDPKSKERTVLIGKGITFDTGGLNVKSSGMDTMKSDMGGAATVLGTIYAASTLGLKVNLTGVIAAAENDIGPTSYKPGDVYKSLSGKTVEIGNTDAEGRLVLADAITYANKHLKPTRMIDFATLTGAMEVTLGAETTGLMSNQDALADALIRAGHETYERLCRLPLYDEYRDQLRSEVADIKSTGGPGARSITAAMFLKDFVGDTPWAHCDIAGTAFLSDHRRYHPKHGTGIGVRLMVEFLESLN